MELTEADKQFIREHLTDDPAKLLLAAGRYPKADIKFLAEQIRARKQIREKLPSWYANEDLIFPSKISAEQSSSEPTALYKQRLISKNSKVCDLTGGLGIDSWYFSRKAAEVIYIERFPDYCEAARHNFEVLNAGNIRIINGDSIQTISSFPEQGIDLFYLDPARRGEGDKRTYALADCEPDLTQILPLLFEKAGKVIAKISPMADIRQTVNLLPGIEEIHVLSVKNECKEIILVLQPNSLPIHPPILTWNIRADKQEEHFRFSREEEEACTPAFAENPESYLYEPNASVLKAGAFKSITRTGVRKLHPSSHLYTSGERIENFPGRSFQIEKVIPFKGKKIKTIVREIPQGNITVRNFPLRVEELRKRTKIKEGGNVYLFATTLLNGEKVLIQCKKTDEQ